MPEREPEHGPRPVAPRLRTGLVYALLIMFCSALLPFIGIFLTAFKTTSELRQGPSRCPPERAVGELPQAWRGFGTYFRAA